MVKKEKKIVLRKSVNRDSGKTGKTSDHASADNAMVAAGAVAKLHEPPPSELAAAATGPLEAWETELFERLRYIHDFHSVSVPQFKNFSGLGQSAKAVLDQYVAQGLVSRTWHASTGRYSLAEEGVSRKNELAARNG